MAEKKTHKMKMKDISEFIPDEAMVHARAARKEMRKSIEAILPPGVAEHHRTARKEMLKFAREMISHAIDRIDEKEKN